jgi:hypothetical protein
MMVKERLLTSDTLIDLHCISWLEQKGVSWKALWIRKSIRKRHIRMSINEPMSIKA